MFDRKVHDDLSEAIKLSFKVFRNALLEITGRLLEWGRGQSSILPKVRRVYNTSIYLLIEKHLSINLFYYLPYICVQFKISSLSPVFKKAAMTAADVHKKGYILPPPRTQVRVHWPASKLCRLICAGVAGYPVVKSLSSPEEH